MYWAGWRTTSTLRIYSWNEGVDFTGIVSNDITVKPYTRMNGDGVSHSPDGTNWAARADSRILGAWVSRGVLGFMWMARQDATFPYPYTIVAQFSEATRGFISQEPIWNPEFAWLYPVSSVNSAGNLAGLLSFGGGAIYPSSAIWVSDDIHSGFAPVSAFSASTGNRGPIRDVWGDYQTVRPHKDKPNTWIAATYSLRDGGDNSNAVPTYIWFGRERDFAGGGSGGNSPPVITRLAASQQGDVLTFTGTVLDSDGDIVQAQSRIFDSFNQPISQTQPFNVNFGNQTTVNLLLQTSSLNNFPSAVRASLIFIDANGNRSAEVIADFSQADPGGPSLSKITFNGSKMTIKGKSLSGVLQVEINGVVVASGFNSPNKKVILRGNSSALNLRFGPNRIRVRNGSLRSNIVVFFL